MKIIAAAASSSSSKPTTHGPPTPPQTEPEFPTTRKPNRRRVLSKREKLAVSGKWVVVVGPTTPLLRWKFNENERGGKRGGGGGGGGSDRKGKTEEAEKKGRREKGAAVSCRKLGAAFWRIQYVGGGGRGSERRRIEKEDDRLGFESYQLASFSAALMQSRAGDSGDRLSCHHGNQQCAFEAKEPPDSPCSVNGPINEYLRKAKPSFQCSNYAMEGATKWDPVRTKASYGNSCNLHVLGSKQNPASVVASLQSELEKARERIEELETERKSSKKKMEHFLRKVSEERAAWRSREHEKVREFIDEMKAVLNREKKSCQRLEIVNAKLLDDLAEAKVSAKRYLKQYEKEWKARELLEEVCDELAKEIGEDKAEVESLKRENMKIREEVEDERKMLQMTEVWREERVQMKLVDAKVTLDEKYAQMNKIIAGLENFLRSRSVAITNTKETREVQMLQQAAASMNVKDMKEFMYEPSKPDDIFSFFEEMAMGEVNEREIEQCVAYKSHSERNNPHDHTIVHPSISYTGWKGDLNDDRYGWKKVSQVEDEGGSSCSPDGSIPSVSRTQRDSSVSGRCMDWEINPCDGTPITEITEVCSPEAEKQSKKASTVSRLWRSCHANGGDYEIVTVEEAVNGKLSSGRISSCGGIVSPADGSVKERFSMSDVDGPWSSSELTNHPHVGQGKKVREVEWPLGVQKSSLKQKLLEARMESQKIQLRQVLKQKI